MASILVVDDEMALLDLMESLLDELGHKTFAVSDGKQALDVLAAQQVDLVICDVMMPIMDGITFLHNMRENAAYNHIKVVMMSAAPPKFTGVQPEKFVPKPYNLDEMEAIIEGMLSSG